MRKAAGVAAASAAVALIGAGAGVSVATPHASSANPTMPTIKVTASGKHTFTVSGDTTFTAGRVKLVLTSVKKEHTAEIGSLHKGYTFKDLNKDFGAYISKAGPDGSAPKSALKHLRRAVRNTNFYGGLDSKGGQTERGTMDLPTAGKYFVVNDNGFPFVNAQKLTVTAPTTPRAAPPSSATVTALTKRRFGGAKVLPAKGTITFTNNSTESPHFLALSQVKKGTTRKQVFKQVKRGFKGPNHFVQGGDQAGSDVLGEGKSQTLSYHIHKGTYAEMCFFNDPKTGMLHALMGMIRIVHVK